jgi:hypothetical protein
MVFENRVLRGKFRHKRNEVTGELSRTKRRFIISTHHQTSLGR